MSGKTTRARLSEASERDRTDWKRVDALSEAELDEAIRRDPDTFVPDPDWFKGALVLRPGQPKQRITMRLDADLLEWFKAQGRGYQTRMNAVLRAYYEAVRGGRET